MKDEKAILKQYGNKEAFSKVKTPESAIGYAVRIWRKANKAFDNALTLPTFQIAKKDPAGGIASWNPRGRVISFTPKVFKLSEIDAILTILHETAHQAASELYHAHLFTEMEEAEDDGHGPLWSICMRKLGFTIPKDYVGGDRFANKADRDKFAKTKKVLEKHEKDRIVPAARMLACIYDPDIEKFIPGMIVARTISKASWAFVGLDSHDTYIVTTRSNIFALRTEVSDAEYAKLLKYCIRVEKKLAKRAQKSQ